MLDLKINYKELKSLKRSEVRNKSDQDIPCEQLHMYISLDASYNHIVTTEGINDFCNIQVLILNDNKIQFLTQLPHSLLYINLSNNMIQDLRDKFGHSIFQNAKNIKHINISKNKIRSLESDIFLQNKKLKSLDLSFNKINKNLSCIIALDELELLDLSNNLIKDLVQFQVFTKKLPSLINIRIKNNPVTIPHSRRCAISLCKNIPNLKYLDDEDIYATANISILQPPEETSREIKSIDIIKMNNNTESIIPTIQKWKKSSQKFIPSIKNKPRLTIKKQENSDILGKNIKLENLLTDETESDYPLTTRSILDGLESDKKTKVEEIYQEYKKEKRNNSTTPHTMSFGNLEQIPSSSIIKTNSSNRDLDNNNHNIFLNLDMTELENINEQIKRNNSHGENELKKDQTATKTINDNTKEDTRIRSNILNNIEFSINMLENKNEISNDKNDLYYIKELNDLRKKLLKDKEGYYIPNEKIFELNNDIQKNETILSDYKKLLKLLIEYDMVNNIRDDCNNTCIDHTNNIGCNKNNIYQGYNDQIYKIKSYLCDDILNELNKFKCNSNHHCNNNNHIYGYPYGYQQYHRHTNYDSLYSGPQYHQLISQDILENLQNIFQLTFKEIKKLLINHRP